MKKQIILTGLIITMIVTAGILLLQSREVDKKDRGPSFSNACIAIEGARFDSIRELDLGLGPDGVIMGHWTIYFENGNFSWTYSDISSTGVYECDGWNITGHYNNGENEHNGTYNRETNILLWEGEEYIKISDT